MLGGAWTAGGVAGFDCEAPNDMAPRAGGDQERQASALISHRHTVSLGQMHRPAVVGLIGAATAKGRAPRDCRGIAALAEAFVRHDERRLLAGNER